MHIEDILPIILKPALLQLSTAALLQICKCTHSRKKYNERGLYKMIIFPVRKEKLLKKES